MENLSIKKFIGSIFLILFSATFSMAVNYSDLTLTHLPVIFDSSSEAVTSDFDNDGDNDIFVANYGEDKLLINNGAGYFTDETGARLPADIDDSRGTTAGDANGDGYMDIFVANNGQNRLLLNDGTGHFSDVSATWLPSGSEFYSSGAFGDIDGDGDMDLIVSVSGISKPIKIFVNDNNTKFLNETTTRLLSDTSHYTQKVILADFDRDSDLDVFTVNSLNNSNKLLINDGTGMFTEDATGIIPADTNSSNSAAVADINGDGLIDYLFVANDGGQRNRLYIYNTSTANFEDKTTANLPVDSDYSFDCAFGDLDSDGDLDVVAANGKDAGQANKVYLNNGGGVFAFASSSFFPVDSDFSTGVITADFDGVPGNEIFITNYFEQRNRLYSTGEVPTAITLSSFTAKEKNRKVIIRWKTETEIDNLGFNVLRSETEDEGYVKINKKLISAKGTSTKGAKYKFTDKNVKSGKTYFYKLEDIDSSRVSTLNDPISLTMSNRKKK